MTAGQGEDLEGIRPAAGVSGVILLLVAGALLSELVDRWMIKRRFKVVGGQDRGGGEPVRPRPSPQDRRARQAGGRRDHQPCHYPSDVDLG
jgi:hypothetical protein